MKDILITSNTQQIIIPTNPIDSESVKHRVSSLLENEISDDLKKTYIKLAISMVDLTTLEGTDTADKVIALSRKAKESAVAAVCVYPNMVPHVKAELESSNINIASVATGFPAGLVPLEVKLLEVKYAIEYGANEIDMVIDRGAFLSGKYQQVFDEIKTIKEACGDVHLKVILETGELQTYENIWVASWIAMYAGADFIKTSTGKVQPAATLDASYIMLNAISDFNKQKNKMIGMKPAGGIRSAGQAIEYLILVENVLGRDWLNSKYFRFGASSLLDDLMSL